MRFAFQILLVEDNDSDAVLVRDHLEGLGMGVRVHHVRDGDQAWAFVTKSPPFGDEPTPDLILLDVNLPRRSGLEVLAAIKSTEKVRRIPVVMLTSSEAELDLTHGYDLHANAFIRKPFGLADLRNTMETVARFWVLAAIRPLSSQ